jgi:anti-sigma factor RsiW
MNEHNELIELLMGKFLDGEISPSEQRLLDEHLTNNPDAGTLFAQLTRLHEISEAAIQARLLDQGPGSCFPNLPPDWPRACWWPWVFCSGNTIHRSGLYRIPIPPTWLTSVSPMQRDRYCAWPTLRKPLSKGYRRRSSARWIGITLRINRGTDT